MNKNNNEESTLQERANLQRNDGIMLKFVFFMAKRRGGSCNATEQKSSLMRENVEPLLFDDNLLSEQLEDDRSHQVPLVLKPQGPFVLEERDMRQVEESWIKTKTIKNK